MAKDKCSSCSFKEVTTLKFWSIPSSACWSLLHLVARICWRFRAHSITVIVLCHWADMTVTFRWHTCKCDFVPTYMIYYDLFNWQPLYRQSHLPSQWVQASTLARLVLLSGLRTTSHMALAKSILPDLEVGQSAFSAERILLIWVELHWHSKVSHSEMNEWNASQGVYSYLFIHV